MRVSISIPYPGWATIGKLDMEEAFTEAANMSVFAVVVAGGGRVARVTFHSEMAALLAIYRITNRIFPFFPGLDGFTTINGHLKAPRIS